MAEDSTLFNIDNFTIINLNETIWSWNSFTMAKECVNDYTRGVPPNPLKFVTKYNLNRTLV